MFDNFGAYFKRILVALIACNLMVGAIMLFVPDNEPLSIAVSVAGLLVTYKYIWPVICRRFLTPEEKEHLDM